MREVREAVTIWHIGICFGASYGLRLGVMRKPTVEVWAYRANSTSRIAKLLIGGITSNPLQTKDLGSAGGPKALNPLFTRTYINSKKHGRIPSLL